MLRASARPGCKQKSFTISSKPSLVTFSYHIQNFTALSNGVDVTQFRSLVFIGCSALIKLLSHSLDSIGKVVNI